MLTLSEIISKYCHFSFYRKRKSTKICHYQLRIRYFQFAVYSLRIFRIRVALAFDIMLLNKQYQLSLEPLLRCECY